MPHSAPSVVEPLGQSLHMASPCDCGSVSSSLKDTVIGLGPFPLQQDLILTDYMCEDPTSK